MTRKVQNKLGEISFSDGHIEQVQLTGGEALVVFRDWHEHIWHLRFQGVVSFQCYEFGGDVSEVQISSDASAIRDAVAVIEQNGGSRAGYSDLVSVTFLRDTPMVTLVCHNLDITKFDAS